MAGLEFGNLSHLGRVRNKNEDFFAVYDTPLGKLFIICDGMGGHNCGELASRMAVDEIRKMFLRVNNNTSPATAISKSLEVANNAIHEQGTRNSEQTGMGTTAVLLLISGNTYVSGHVGDSRIYRICNGRIERVTKDHSYVQTLVDRNLISLKDAQMHPEKNKILYFLGQGHEMQYSIQGPLPLQGHDKFVLCSDGLSDLLDDQEIFSITQSNPPQEACLRLQDLALKRGGHDNITIQVVQIVGNRPAGHNKLPLHFNSTESSRSKTILNWLIAIGVTGAALVNAVGILIGAKIDWTSQNNRHGSETSMVNVSKPDVQQSGAATNGSTTNLSEALERTNDDTIKSYRDKKIEELKENYGHVVFQRDFDKVGKEINEKNTKSEIDIVFNKTKESFSSKQKNQTAN